MLGGNLGSLLYGDVSVTISCDCIAQLVWGGGGGGGGGGGVRPGPTQTGLYATEDV